MVFVSDIVLGRFKLHNIKHFTDKKSDNKMEFYDYGKFTFKPWFL